MVKERDQKKDLPSENKDYKEAEKKFLENGSLGVTAEDHVAIGSTPSQQLRENPGKTLADLMTDQEILNWLNSRVQNIREFIKMGSSAQYLAQNFKDSLSRNLNYLKKLNRLPVEFNNFNIDSIQ